MTDLGCPCACGGDYSGRTATVCCRAVVRVARRPYVCCECQGRIGPGERYEDASGLDLDSGWWSAKTCLVCSRIRADLCTTWVYGQLRADLWDALGLDYVSGEIDEGAAPGDRWWTL